MPSCTVAMPPTSAANAAMPARLSKPSLALVAMRAFQGFHQAARAEPDSKPIKWVSVPR